MQDFESDPLVTTVSQDETDIVAEDNEQEEPLPTEVGQSYEALLDANTTQDKATVESARIAFFTSIKQAFGSVHEAPDSVYEQCDLGLRNAKDIIGS